MSASDQIQRVIAVVEGLTRDDRIRAALRVLSEDVATVADRLDRVADGGEGLPVDVGGVTVAAELIAIRMLTIALAVPTLPAAAAFELITAHVEMLRALRVDNPEPFAIELREWLRQKTTDVHATIVAQWKRGGYSPQKSVVVDRPAADLN